jgi:hypothetical protein
MSNDQIPTPETHASKFMPCNAGPGWTRTQWFVTAEFAENLERRRDELLKSLERLKKLAATNPHCPIGLAFEHCEPSSGAAIAAVRGPAVPRC